MRNEMTLTCQIGIDAETNGFRVAFFPVLVECVPHTLA